MELILNGQLYLLLIVFVMMIAGMVKENDLSPKTCFAP